LKLTLDGFETDLLVFVAKKRQEKEFAGFWPFGLVLRQTSGYKFLHLRTYLSPLAFAEEERCLFHFFLNLPFVFAKEVQIVEEELISNDP
jgi:hypothetical protein